MNMKSSTKEKKKMLMTRGFMCQSPAATTVCASIADARAVVLPRRPAASHLHHGHGHYMMMRRSTTIASLDHTDHTPTRSLLSNKYNANACSRHNCSRHLNTSASTPPHDDNKLHTFNPSAAAYNKKPSSLTLPRPSSINRQAADHHDHDLTLKHQQPLSKSSIQRSRPSSDSVLPSSADNVNLFQVVVMRVSLHCHGCAGKVKKHLSKMEGVTSFSIDLETKMVTVRGHVSPDGVLESISKVKKAEFWPC